MVSVQLARARCESDAIKLDARASESGTVASPHICRNRRAVSPRGSWIIGLVDMLNLHCGFFESSCISKIIFMMKEINFAFKHQKGRTIGAQKSDIFFCKCYFNSEVTLYNIENYNLKDIRRMTDAVMESKNVVRKKIFYSNY